MCKLILGVRLNLKPKLVIEGKDTSIVNTERAVKKISPVPTV